MDIRIHPSSSTPIYTQVVDGVRRLIARRALRPDDRLPSVRELATTLRINRNTAARAYGILEADGHVTTRHGQGTFVASTQPRTPAAELADLLYPLLDRLLREATALGVDEKDLARLLKRRARAFDVVSASAENEQPSAVAGRRN